MKLKSKDIGNRGEALACEYLITKGYKILATQFTANHRKGEIDIIAFYEKNIYAFVEVKYRTISYGVYAGDLISKKKQKNLLLMALSYCQKNDIALDENIIRFDVIHIIEGEIHHIENAFEPR